ncbi:N-acetylmuramoyl-L-alanine amidase-like domain-containing protein [Luteolibacter sp. LG18]|uniref:N-acetylmuramoyl-L-alanine amidase-like domain-containing protein n=1 Tax=Luteolibacter sp. LG18 TaxID=2819286 RepID=UPI002B2B323C|nr:hypothetical protein llg_06480 [Luteolibacter sp. LG18]
MIGKVVALSAAVLLGLGASARADVLPVPVAPRLPLDTVFKGQTKFQAIMAKAERENWRALPLGARTVRIGRELVGTPYQHYTLEVDDHIESPVVNLTAMDCWTYYENALAMARLISYKPGPYKPEDLLQMVELERYRGGRCTGEYLSRMHQLEEVFYDNQRRGIAENITPRIPGAEGLSREIHEMTVQWKDYRYLRNNPGLLPGMAAVEARVSKLPVSYVPKSKVLGIEKYLADGDICAITGADKSCYTTHVGLIVRVNGRAYFSHATSDRDKGKMVVIDRPITDYLNGMSKHTGIIVCRPKDLPPSSLWQKNIAGEEGKKPGAS